MAFYEVTDERVWRDRAATLADALLQRFAHENGRLLTTTSEGDLLMAPEDTGDDDFPSGSSAAIDLLSRLSVATENRRYAWAASRVLRYLSGHRRRRQPP